ncbi:MAG: DUF4270 family protein, partial [Muribaculaceae bacterium]|nr:DUF4270 family protein [Muribaculaceae bacterium]
FDPTGYYDPADPLGSRSFTLSALGMSDSLYIHQPFVSIVIPMSREMALETVQAYNNPAINSVFQWPQTFEQYFHGIYVEPSFGRGCVANIVLTDFIIYYHYYKTETSEKDDGTVTSTVKTEVRGAGVFRSSPIVLSSNNITYRPSDSLIAMAARNDALVTSPGGYRINLRFPGQELMDIFQQSQSKLAVVSDLKFSIPVEEIENDYDITPPPYLIMVKSSKLDEFLASNSLPDGKDSFYAVYKNKRYSFTSMRNYILDLIRNGVKDEDLDFTIIPANIEFEQEQQSTNSYDSYLAMLFGFGYGSSNSSTSSDPIKCTPYIAKPSMCKLKMDEARTIFTYSTQIMK